MIASAVAAQPGAPRRKHSIANANSSRCKNERQVGRAAAPQDDCSVAEMPADHCAELPVRHWISPVPRGLTRDDCSEQPSLHSDDNPLVRPPDDHFAVQLPARLDAKAVPVRVPNDCSTDPEPRPDVSSAALRPDDHYAGSRSHADGSGC